MLIHSYAKRGDIAGVAQQISLGVDIDCIDKYPPYTPLMCALASPDANIDIIRFLVEHGANINAVESEYQDPVLYFAVRSGNLDKIKFLLDAGADIHYQTCSGCDVLINAMQRIDIFKDENLLSIINLLIERGAKLTGESTYGESALSITSRVGRFDAIKLLLTKGADSKILKWNELMYAVALGGVEDVKSLLDKGTDLSERDRWNRTAWLLSLQVGDVEKAKLLLSSGANRNDLGHCGQTPLMYAIANERIEVLEWLIKEGFDIEATDEYENTPLIVAAESGATYCVQILLKAGANIKKVNKYDDKAIKITSNLQIVRMLVNAGEDLNDINEDMRRLLTGMKNTDLQLSQEQYDAGKRRRFGKTNPECMNIDFWKEMVRCGVDTYCARNTFVDTDPFPYKPIWCYQRFGRTITELPDGRIVEIAGEHEDYYDPDFCIYNDLVVFDGDGDFKIWGYPEDVFPPTDFHTATLIENYIYIIGSLGYCKKRIYNETPVYRLHCDTFKIEKIETTGAKPGWISRHKAFYVETSKILIKGGKICLIVNDLEDYIDNSANYILDITNMKWTKVKE